MPVEGKSGGSQRCLLSSCPRSEPCSYLGEVFPVTENSQCKGPEIVHSVHLGSVDSTAEGQSQGQPLEPFPCQMKTKAKSGRGTDFPEVTDLLVEQFFKTLSFQPHTPQRPCRVSEQLGTCQPTRVNSQHLQLCGSNDFTFLNLSPLICKMGIMKAEARCEGYLRMRGLGVWCVVAVQ